MSVCVWLMTMSIATTLDPFLKKLFFDEFCDRFCPINNNDTYNIKRTSEFNDFDNFNEPLDETFHARPKYD